MMIPLSYYEMYNINRFLLFIIDIGVCFQDISQHILQPLLLVCRTDGPGVSHKLHVQISIEVIEVQQISGSGADVCYGGIFKGQVYIPSKISFSDWVRPGSSGNPPEGRTSELTSLEQIQQRREAVLRRQ